MRFGLRIGAALVMVMVGLWTAAPAKAAETTVTFDNATTNGFLTGVHSSDLTSKINWGPANTDYWWIDGAEVEQLVHFNDLSAPNPNFGGTYPTSFIGWEANKWYLSDAWEAFDTNSISFRSGVTSASFSFSTPRGIRSFEAYNSAGSSTTVTIQCGTASEQWTLAATEKRLLRPHFFNHYCINVTLTTGNGWATNFDNFLVVTEDLNEPRYLKMKDQIGSPIIDPAHATFTTAGHVLKQVTFWNPTADDIAIERIICGNQQVGPITIQDGSTGHAVNTGFTNRCPYFEIWEPTGEIRITGLVFDFDSAQMSVPNGRYAVNFDEAGPSTSALPPNHSTALSGIYPANRQMLDFGIDGTTNSPWAVFTSNAFEGANILELMADDVTIDVKSSNTILRNIALYNRNLTGPITVNIACAPNSAVEQLTIPADTVEEFLFEWTTPCTSINITTNTFDFLFVEVIDMELEVGGSQPVPIFGNDTIELDPFDLQSMTLITGAPANQKIAFPYLAGWFGPYNRINIYADTTVAGNASGTVKVALYDNNLSNNQPSELLRKCEITGIPDNVAAWYSCSISDVLLDPGQRYHLVVWHAAQSGFTPVFRAATDGFFAHAGGSGDFPAEGGSWSTTYSPITSYTNASFFMDHGATNTPPTISNIANQTTNEDTAESNVPFTIGDTEDGASGLTLSATSSNTTLVPNANITFGGSGANRTITVTPAANQNGTATITVRVTDSGSLFAEDTFTQTVTSVNDNPTVSNITDQSTSTGVAVSNIAFTVGDVETAAGSLTVWGASSNTTLLPTANITFGGSGANRTVTVTPASGQTGTSTVTVSATDANNGTGSDSFVLTVSGNTAPTISDQGNLTRAAGTGLNMQFTVGDAETPLANLVGTVTSSNQSVLPSSAITQVTGTGSTRTYIIQIPDPGTLGQTTITHRVTDGGGLYTEDTWVLTVVTPSPVVTTTSGSTTYTHGSGNVVIDSGITVTDANSTNLTGATVVITSNCQQGWDVMAVTISPTDNIDWGFGDCTLTMAGTDTLANYQTLLRAVAFQSTHPTPSTATRTITFTANDGTTTGSNTRTIVFGSGGSSIADRSTASGDVGNASSLTYSHTVTSGSNRVLFVAVDDWKSGGGTGPTGVTYGGTAMTQIGTAFNAGSNNDNKMTLWRLTNPATGANNVVVSYGSAHDITAVSVSYTGVNQTTPNDTPSNNDTTSTTPSHNISSETGDMVVSIVGWWGSGAAATATGDLTERIENNNGSGVNSLALADAPGEASATSSWSLTGSPGDVHGQSSFNVNKAP